MTNVIVRTTENIIATLRPKQGIQCEENILYLFDPNVVVSITEATAREWLEQQSEAYLNEYIKPIMDAYEEEKERDIDAYVEEKQSTIFFDNTNFTGTTTAETLNITGATTIGDKLTTVGDIILENGERTRYIRFKKSNDDTIHAQISNMYVSNVLSTLNFSSTYNTEKYAQISMSAGKNIKSSVSVTAEENDEATDSTNIGRKQIATQGWVNNPEKSLNVVHRSGDEEISGRKDFLDGITAPNQLDYTNISNCITEIPQNIKLELNNGVLTLKAGSKVYVPNGAGVFDVVTIANDLTATSTSNEQNLIFLFNGGLGSMPIKQCFSGSSAPSAYQYMFWYDTTNNLVKFTADSGSTWTANSNSLPLGLVTVSSLEITSIDQVFNGFGYIGSTVFALPGVKGLIPNGRNEDGSLKNIELNITEVRTSTGASTDASVIGVVGVNSITNYNSYGLVYDETSNYMYHSGEIVYQIPYTNIYSQVNGKIGSNIKFKIVFHAVDYDTKFIGRQAMPSDKFVNLNLLASDSGYTAPANGYFTIDKIGTALRCSIKRNGIEIGLGGGQSSGGSYNQRFNIPVIEGDICYLYYNSVTPSGYFRFVYAEGSK